MWEGEARGISLNFVRDNLFLFKTGSPGLLTGAPVLKHSVFVEGEADLDGDLPVGDFLIFDVAAGFNYFNPADIPDRFSGFGYGVVDSLFDAAGRGADNFKFLIDMCAHDDV